MNQALQTRWAGMAIRGGFAIALATLLTVWRDPPLWGVAIAFGVFALADAVGAAVFAYGGDASGRYNRPFVAVALTGVFAGAVCLLWSGMPAFALSVLIAVWALLRGTFEVTAAVQLFDYITAPESLGLIGAVSALLGMLMAVLPGGIIGLYWLVAMYAFLVGLLSLMFAAQLRHRPGEVAGVSA
jgi:uncharacterized membrane protein HdeD (DUF308 family)